MYYIYNISVGPFLSPVIREKTIGPDIVQWVQMCLSCHLYVVVKIQSRAFSLLCIVFVIRTFVGKL